MLQAGSSAVVAEASSGNNTRMPISARNQFPGKVIYVRSGAVMSEVALDIGGGHQIVSLISTSSVKRLKLKKGSPAVAVIKATEVIISTDLPDAGERS
jgi:molybdate transport system regulatory protein